MSSSEQSQEEGPRLSNEAIKARMAFAERQFDRHNTDINLMVGHSITFGVEAIKTCALINGGAFAATLAFSGAIFGKNPETAQALAGAAVIFSVGVLLSGVASGFAYFSQTAFANQVGSVEYSYDYPHIRDQPEASGWEVWGTFCQWVAIIAVVSAYGLLLVGALQFRGAMHL